MTIRFCKIADELINLSPSIGSFILYNNSTALSRVTQYTIPRQGRITAHRNLAHSANHNVALESATHNL